MSEEWPTARVVHIKGGIRAVNKYGPPVHLHPEALNNKLATFETRSYGSLFNSLETRQLPIIGVEFYTYSHQFEGTALPEWRVFSRDASTVWGNEEGSQLWSNIGTGAHKEKNGRLWDVASRVSHQLGVCSWRLKEISESYKDQLNTLVKKNEFEACSRFSDRYTWLCYMAIQSFLFDACILRDYLAEYAAHYVFGGLIIGKTPNVSSLSGLRKIILNKAESDDELFREFRDITGDDGWLKILGSYRDLVAHSAPLAQAEKRLFAICETLPINDDKLPIICCPIPKNPLEIAASRSKGDLFEDFEKQFKLFVGMATEEGPHIDGLDYCHEVMSELSKLANKLGGRSPVKPQMMVLDKSNIIGEVKVETIK